MICQLLREDIRLTKSDGQVHSDNCWPGSMMPKYSSASAIVEIMARESQSMPSEAKGADRSEEKAEGSTSNASARAWKNIEALGSAVMKGRKLYHYSSKTPREADAETGK